MALILASRSATRAALLKGVGLAFTVRTSEDAPALAHVNAGTEFGFEVEMLAAEGSGLDERAIEAVYAARGAGSSEIAQALAEAKALLVAASGRDLVIGADQTLTLNERRLHKPGSRAEARAQILALAGETHVLHAAVAVVRDRQILFSTVAEARLTMRALGETEVDRYLDAAGPAVLTSVGGYQIEGLGLRLFERIEGDHATILGLPLLPLLAFLRESGEIDW